MEKYIAKFKNSNIIKVLEVAKPKIEERTEKYIQAVIKEEQRHPSDFAIEMYQLGLIYDLVKALSKYIYDSDDLTYIELSTQRGIYVMMGVVIRSGVRYWMDTEIILAGGYNIQCLHIRYIVKTNLPKPEKENSLAAKVKDLIKSKNAIQRLEEDEIYAKSVLVREVENIKQKMLMTDQEIIESKSWLAYMLERVWENLSADVQKNFDNSKEEFERRRNKEVNEAITSHRASYSQKRIEYLEKEYKKKIEKINIKRKKIEG